MAHEVLTTYEEELLALHDTLKILSGKWKMQIIALLCNGEFRYSELKTAISKITPKMLSKELKQLEQEQLITRTVYDTTPVQVTYQLAEYGESLPQFGKDLTRQEKRVESSVCALLQPSKRLYRSLKACR
jgi:DNA-binding HxlR family transcriptional regulator